MMLRTSDEAIARMLGLISELKPEAWERVRKSFQAKDTICRQKYSPNREV